MEVSGVSDRAILARTACLPNAEAGDVLTEWDLSHRGLDLSDK